MLIFYSFVLAVNVDKPWMLFDVFRYAIVCWKPISDFI